MCCVSQGSLDPPLGAKAWRLGTPCSPRRPNGPRGWLPGLAYMGPSAARQWRVGRQKVTDSTPKPTDTRRNKQPQDGRRCAGRQDQSALYTTDERQEGLSTGSGGWVESNRALHALEWSLQSLVRVSLPYGAHTRGMRAQSNSKNRIRSDPPF